MPQIVAAVTAQYTGVAGFGEGKVTPTFASIVHFALLLRALMNQPLVPRHPSGAAGEVMTETSSVDLVRMGGLLFRGVGISVALVLLLYGAYHAIDVFVQVGRLLKDPSQAAPAVDSLAEIIDAPQLKFLFNGQDVGVGRAVAVILLGLGYLLWAWIPLAIIGAAGKLLHLLAGGRPAPPPPPPRGD